MQIVLVTNRVNCLSRAEYIPWKILQLIHIFFRNDHNVSIISANSEQAVFMLWEINSNIRDILMYVFGYLVIAFLYLSQGTKCKAES